MGDIDWKLFVLDINILFYEFFVIYFFKEYDVVILMIVFEEFDWIKDSKCDVVCDVCVVIWVLEYLFYDVIFEEIIEGILFFK